MDAGISAVRVAPPAAAADPDLCFLSAANQGWPRSSRLGGRRAAEDGAPFGSRAHSFCSGSACHNLWMFGAAYVEATTAALIVISLMLTMRVVSWKEMAGNHTAWTTLT